MKKYTNFPVDCTSLASEVLAYLNNQYDIEDAEHRTNAWHSINPTDLNNTSINSTFSGLTVTGLGHVTVNSDAMRNHCSPEPFLIIPLADCETVSVKIFDVASGATLYPDAHYADEDCTLLNTIPLVEPLLINGSTTFTVECSNVTKLGDILMIWFNEDISSYFAE